ncbi:MAG: aminoglycoside phosphotransferase family protein [Nitrospirota bacterium]|nr:aminoglycoside phosphotransferase family protein [Nitrospirota bacterium]
MINEDAIRAYLFQQFKDILQVEIRRIGSGVQGSGFLIEMKTSGGEKSYVVKALLPEGFGHDYPSDRAAVFLLDLDEYRNLPRHVEAVDVLAEMEDGTVKSIGGGIEYYLLMEKVEGRDYFKDLASFAGKERLENQDIEKIASMARYLAEIHALKKDSKTLYWRKLRDTVGHGECLMGVFDIYPDGTVPYEVMTNIIKKSVDWIYRLKPRYKRLSQIHGDFHPGNIWFKEAKGEGQRAKGGEESNSQLREPVDFVLLDRSRGPWGEPADDVTALTINYVFFSVKKHGDVRGAYLEGLKLFFEEYIKATGDGEITEVVAPFYAFRAAVVANPVFYPELGAEARQKIFRFAESILSQDSFAVERVNGYLQG